MFPIDMTREFVSQNLSQNGGRHPAICPNVPPDPSSNFLNAAAKASTPRDPAYRLESQRLPATRQFVWLSANGRNRDSRECIKFPDELGINQTRSIS
jgi:hypothetical protein